MIRAEKIEFLLNGSNLERCTKSKNTTVLLRLATNMQELECRDTGTSEMIRLDEISEVNEGVKGFLPGKSKTQRMFGARFSIHFKNTEKSAIVFCTRNRIEQIHWIDGLRMLLNSSSLTRDTQADQHLLLSIFALASLYGPPKLTHSPTI